MRLARGGREVLIRSVAHVEEADVVALAVKSPEHGLIVEREIVHADTLGLRCRVLGVETERRAPVCLRPDPTDAAGGQADVVRAEVPFPHDHGEAERL